MPARAREASAKRTTASAFAEFQKLGLVSNKAATREPWHTVSSGSEPPVACGGKCLGDVCVCPVPSDL